jgi:cysteine-rich repeat protein
VLRFSARGRRGAALALAGVLAVVGTATASSADEADLCIRDKLRAARVAATVAFSCRLRGHGNAARTEACLAKGSARATRILDAAEARAAASGFVCPARLDALGGSARSSWPAWLMAEGSGWGSEACVAPRARAARRFTFAWSRALEKSAPGGAPDTRRAASARATFLASWPAVLRGCPTIAAAGVLTRLESEIAESASRLEVRCGDGHLAGFEECDDGNGERGDGCSADCRLEDCGRVDGEVRCVVCPEGAVANGARDGCRCPDGYEGEPGHCVDIDECAMGAAVCPAERPCVNLAGTWACAIPCTAEAFHAALASCGAPSGAIAFACEDTTIAIPPGAGKPARDVLCNGLVVDGAGRGIAFELDPACWNTILLPEQCPGGLAPDGTCFCPDVDSGEQFLLLRGNDNVVRDLTVRGFFDGIPVRGRRNLVENVRFERLCDDAFGSVSTGVGNVFRRLSVRLGCDKCSENGGSIADTDPDPRVPEHYNGILRDVDFDGCRAPVRVSSAGRFLLDGVTMGSTDSAFPCDGPRFTSASGSDVVALDVLRSTVANCRHGLRLGRGAQASIRDSRFSSCRLRGLRLASTAKASVEGTTFDSNGGGGSSEGGFGGVALVGSDASLDLGGGELTLGGRTVRSAGANSLCDNRAPNGSRREVETDAAVTVPAAGNWWCSASPWADRLVGPVETTPLLGRAPLRFRER